MINLIPNEEKKKMVQEFYLRFVVVFFFVLGFSVLIATVAILPSYFLSSLKKNLASDKAAAQRAEPEPSLDSKTSSIIEDLNNKLSIVEKAEKNKYSISEKVINEILLKKIPDIRITEITYKNEAVAGKTISIRGIAPSRERLLIFRKTLEEDPAFKKVDLPISNFIKGTDIAFFINLTPS